MSGYLDHHGFRRGAPEASRTEGPPCSECGRPMLAGQKGRHGVCSPKMGCCDARSDLVRNPTEHKAQHAEMAVGL